MFAQVYALYTRERDTLRIFTLPPFMTEKATSAFTPWRLAMRDISLSPLRYVVTLIGLRRYHTMPLCCREETRYVAMRDCCYARR